MCVMRILPSVKAERIDAQGMNTHYNTQLTTTYLLGFYPHFPLRKMDRPYPITASCNDAGTRADVCMLHP